MNPRVEARSRRSARWAIVWFAGFAGIVLAQRPERRACDSCSSPGLLMCPSPATVTASIVHDPGAGRFPPGWTNVSGASDGVGSGGR